MSVLDMLQEAKQERTAHLRTVAIGADLIPRSAADDPHVLKDDPWGLIGRALNDEVRENGLARRSVTVAGMPAELRVRAEEIGVELGLYDLFEIGRWATDVQLAYARVPHLTEEIQAAIFHAWSVALEVHFESEDAA